MTSSSFLPAGCASHEPSETPITRPSVEVTTLSRGRGVPKDADDALSAIEEFANKARSNGDVVSITSQIFGLEGETRLCIVFRDSLALDSNQEAIEDLASGVELLSVRKDHCASN